MNNNKPTEDVKYPHFIENQPCGDDLFEGKSHETIAKTIAELLKRTDNNNVIGIDGGWGSGKSNLVKIVEKQLDKEKYHFFIYDAWGHQEDLQRRSILEELTADLTTETSKHKTITNSKKWEKKLQDLLAKKRNVESRSIPKLSCGIILSALAIILTPILDTITKNCSNIKIKIWIMCIPLLSIILLLLILIIKNICKYKRFWFALRISVSEIFNVYSDKIQERTTTETISEKEPSSKEFRDWMEDINKDLGSNKLVIVFDNMDRLPNQKVQELWAAIHTFFAEKKYSNIKVIIPFDREHIKSAFKKEDIKTYPTGSPEGVTQENIHCYGDDFINKTFNVVYRVSPPTMTNWIKYFNIQWKEAFGIELESDSRVTQIYDLLTPIQTPRNINAFINEFVSIKQIISNNEIPDEYIALFIFGKSKISNNPNEEILKPTYLETLNFLYANDENLPKYISALYYQLPPDNALDVIYTEKLKRAMDEKNSKSIKLIQNLPIFDKLLENAITKISNVPNAVLSLNDCYESNNTNITNNHWDCLYRKTEGYQEESLQEYQKILLQKVSKKQEYLQVILNNFATNSTIKYYESVKQLGNIEGLDPYKYLKEIKVSPENFITFVEQAKFEYAKYKIICDKAKLDEYLSGFDITHLGKLNAISYIKDDYVLPLYSEHLNKIVDSNLDNKNSISIIFNRLKEIERPIKKIIPDQYIYTFFSSSTESDEFYYDLVCMRIARLGSFPPSYDSSFINAMAKTDDNLIEKIAERLEYYMDYGTILLNIEAMKDHPLYKAVAIKITEKSYGISIMYILDVLQKYDSIINVLNITPEILIKHLNDWNYYAATSVSSNNVNSIPVKFFEDSIELDFPIVKHCQNVAVRYLESISKDDWKKSLVNLNNNYKLLILLQPKIQNCFEVFNDILCEYAKGEKISITKDMCDKMISLSEKNNRSLLSMFKNIRDCFCGGQATMTSELFNFYGRWLFKYSMLEEKEESLRAIFPSTVLDNEDNMALILEFQNIMEKIISKAGEENKNFKDKMQVLIDEKYKDNNSFIEFANAIGIHKTVQEENDKK
jgi:hypothetical protein